MNWKYTRIRIFLFNLFNSEFELKRISSSELHFLELMVKHNLFKGYAIEDEIMLIGLKFYCVLKRKKWQR